MRKVLVILIALLLAAPLAAQQRTGRIIGTVVDTDGNPIPGVAVTLLATAGAPMQSITTAEGSFRFLALPPSTGYALKAELEGFKTKTETNVIVVVGQTTEIRLEMEMGALEEEVTVVAVSPVVDTKKTAISTTMNYETLQSLPSARDPWVILQMTPSIQVDRENVGGNESGQQAGYVALGGMGDQHTWTMDGVNITDPAAMGASPTYYDYDVFEEVNVTIGGVDIEAQTGGVGINFVSRRGENRITFGGRFYYTESAFQAKPTGSDYEEIEKIFPGYGYNQIRDNKDYGFNIGGPLLKDKIWWWGSWGTQDIKTKVLNGSNDDTLLVNMAAKVNIQLIPENRLELFIHAGDKKKWGRGSGSTYPAGRNQHGKYHFGSPILKIQDEHMFGDSFFVSAKFGFTDAGFGLWPADDEDLTKMRRYDDTNQLYTYYSWFMTQRPNTQITAHGTYFNDDLLGASHEIKLGLEYVHRYDTWTSGNAGNLRVDYNFNDALVDWDGNGTRDVMIDEHGIDLMRLYVYRGVWKGGPEGCYQWSGFLSDTISWNRLTIKLGLRYDYQTFYTKGNHRETILNSDTDALYWENYYEIQQRHLEPGLDQAILSIFPGIKIPEVTTSETIPWSFLSPRLALTYDITGDGKTIAKLSAAVYGSRAPSYYASLWQRGGAGGGLNFYWHDVNGDDVANFNELYWADYTQSARPAYRAFDDNGNFIGDWDKSENLNWSGYDPQDPGKSTDPWTIFDPDWQGYKTYELIASLERELIPDFMIGADFTIRKYNEWEWSRSYADYFGGRFLTKDDYIEAPNKVPSTFTSPDGDTIDLGEAAGRPFWVWKAGVEDVYGSYRTNMPSDYYDIYWGLSVRFAKRLSNRWMLNGSFTFQDQRNYWGETYPLNPTNQWAQDGKLYAYQLGGSSGKYGMRVFSTWMFKVQGLYQLPYDFNVSFTFNAREGHILDQYISVQDYEMDPAIYSPYTTGATLMRAEAGDARMPTFWNLNMRLEKILKLGDMGRIYLMIDAFNVFNQNILNRARDDNPGTIYLHDGTFSINTRSAEPNEVLNPRTIRFGVRFQF
jgi:hypothetical protein